MTAEKKADVWMPLWIGAYLADTMKLTTVQHGAYFLLLIAYWRERKPLADKDDELRSITKMERAEWKRTRPILAEFFKIGDGVWWHKRVEAEIAAADARSKKAAEKAGKAAQARWGGRAKDDSSNASSMPGALLDDMHDECPPPSHTPLPSGDSEAKASAAKPASDLTKSELWEAGKSLLLEAGVPKGQCGSFVGKLVGDYGDAIVIDAVRAAVVESPADPREYLKATCMRMKGERGADYGKPRTVPSDAADKTREYLESRVMTPEEQARANEAAAVALAKLGRTTKAMQ